MCVTVIIIIIYSYTLTQVSHSLEKQWTVAVKVVMAIRYDTQLMVLDNSVPLLVSSVSKFFHCTMVF